MDGTYTIPTSSPPAGYRDVNPATVAHTREHVRVVDVRESHEFYGELGHVPGAELVPLGHLLTAAPHWAKDHPIVLVCRSGARSGNAAHALTRLGFKHVMNMVGGMMAWSAEGLPVER
jgi:rhodanese-related sulfurtransferase